MTDIFLVAINSRYNHTNLAVRSIVAYAQQQDPTMTEDFLTFEEFSIANFAQDILHGIIKQNPKIVIFSVYIWNTRLVFDVIRELRKVRPDILIGAGGPDVSYRAREVFTNYDELDFIIQGEGELTDFDIFQSAKNLIEQNSFSREEFIPTLKKMKGIYSKQLDGSFLYGGIRPYIEDLSIVPFAYPVLDEVDTKLFYYESSRGCPFLCTYCLSSIEKGVRFMPLERVYEDLTRFLEARVRIIKFVDRTFNLNTKRYLAMWKWIVANHNGYTMFHFEIAAEFLDDEALDFLQTVPAGIMQFEVGIQSTNPATLQAIKRPANLDKLVQKVSRIPKTIHSHLDLIAGLPYESLTEFAESFNFVLNLRPDMLQLGFLKVLAGTQMEQFAKENNYKWLTIPPHEVLETPYISYDELYFLHNFETVLDWYYNSGNFATSIEFLLQNAKDSYNLFETITQYFTTNKVFDLQYKIQAHFSLLADFIKNNAPQFSSIAHELIRFDYFKMQKTSVFPDCFELHYDKDKHHAGLIANTDMHSTRESYTNSAFETFSINPQTLETKETSILFLYGKRAEKKVETQVIVL